MTLPESDDRQPGAVAALADSVRSGRRSAISVTEEALERISSFDDAIGAFVVVDRARATVAARRVDELVSSGENPGPLAGVPIGVKDVLDVAGFSTRRGSRATNSGRAASDDNVVARLRAAGAVVIGKTATGEFGTGFTTATLDHEDTANPANLMHSAGGSSGGSAAAVAAGFVPLAVGTDSGGSVRVPAAFCGLVGLLPGSEILDLPARDGLGFTRIGVMARSVADARLWLSAQASNLVSGSVAGSIAPMRVAVLDAGHGIPIDADATQGMDRAVAALREIGCSVEPDPVLQFPSDLGLEAWGVLSTADLLTWARRSGIWPQARALMTEPLSVGLAFAETIDSETADAAHAELRRVRDAVAEACDRFDVLIAPTAATPAPIRGVSAPRFIGGREASLTGLAPFAPLANLCGLPAVALPVSETQDRLPLSVQLLGRPRSDLRLLDLAQRLEAALDGPETIRAHAGSPTTN